MGTKLLKISLVTLLAVAVFGMMPIGTVLAEETETLRPNGVGNSTNIPDESPGGVPHWQLVDEAGTGDGSSTIVFTQVNAWREDLYAMQNSSKSGVINNVTVFARAQASIPGVGQSRVVVRTLGTTTLGNVSNLSTGYALTSGTWALNPTSGLPWTWTDIDNIEAGVRLKVTGGQVARCTQVYIEVDYTAEPAVVTNAATNITTVSATLNGNITDIGAGNTTSRGFDYGLTDSYGEQVVEAGAFSTGTYEGNITSLAPGTLYHFRAKATNDEGTGHGNDKMFMTLPVAPTVSNRVATRVSATTARLNGSLDNDGGAATTVSIFWGLADGAGNATNWTNEEVVGVTAEGLFNADISNLTLNTLYFFQARAVNSEGTDWADSTASFRTLTGVPNPVSFLATPDDTTTNVSLQWSWGNASASEVLIRYGADVYPANVTQGILVFSGARNSYLHSGLDSGVTVKYTIWGKDGTLYSSRFISALATTSATITGAAPVGAPDAPTGWLQSPDPTALENFQPFYDLTNGVIDSWNMPRATGWLVASMMLYMFFAFLIFLGSRGSFAAAALALCVMMVSGTIMGLIPGWMGFTTVIATLSVMALQGQEAT